MGGRMVAGVPGRRARVKCPVCGRDVALTPKTGVIGRHFDRSGKSSGYYCDAVGMLPGGRARAADLRRLAELVFAYPERARELVAQLPRRRRGGA